MDEIFAVLYYNSIHKRSSFSMVFDGDSIVSKSEDLLFFLSLKCPTIILHYAACHEKKEASHRLESR